MFKNGDLAKVVIPNSGLDERIVKVVGVHTKLPVVNSVYIVILQEPHDEEWSAYTVPEGHLVKIES